MFVFRKQRTIVLFIISLAGMSSSVFSQEVVEKDSTLVGDSSIQNISFFVKKDSLKKADKYYYDSEIEQVLNSKLPKEYVISEVKVNGANNYDHHIILSLASLQVGQKITLPGGDQIGKAIQNLWAQNLFENVEIFIAKVEDRSVVLEIDVVEKPRLSNFAYKGIGKSDQEEIQTKVGSVKKRIITNQMKRNVTEVIRKFYLEKGFLNVQVGFKEQVDEKNPLFRTVVVHVNKGTKNKIQEIAFFGNTLFSNYKLKNTFGETKVLPRLTLYPNQNNFYFGKIKTYSFREYIEGGGFLVPTKTLEFLDPYFRWNIFNGAKFDKEKFGEDKLKVVELYQTNGFRDVSIEKDTVYIDPFNQRLTIEIKINEGKKYYFGNIGFNGNTKYTDSFLYAILGIKKGDVYNIETLNKKLGKKLTPDGMGNDIGSLYMDDGYLFFNVDVVESKIYNDTIDYILNIREGPQATIKKINISGNEKTRDYVVRRELRTYPGEKFSRSDLIRSQRELMNLSFFNPEKIGINPVPNMEDGTVDINYTVEEKSSDQVELSAGYSGFLGLTGTLGLSFNNFSTKHFFDKEAWKPLPSGDGQKLSLRLQSSGKSFYTGNISFVEPWLTQKRRTSLTLSSSYSFFGRTTNQSGYIDLKYVDSSNIVTFNSGISLGTQLKWPDDYFMLSVGLNYTLYSLKNYALSTTFNNGTATNLNLRVSLSRNSTDQPLFTRSGSNISLMAQFTPPYSFFNPNVDGTQWAEYHKWRFNAEWFLPLTRGFGVDKNRQLILRLGAKYGFLGRYNDKREYTPFERFRVGDQQAMMNNFSFLGFDVIAHRGYYVYNNSDPKVNPQLSSSTNNFTIFNKYLAELRYPISTNPSATIFVTTYFEAANGWFSMKDYNPLELRRSVGVGARFFLPMFGLLGFDYAIGIDRMNEMGSIGGAARFSFILGMEPD